MKKEAKKDAVARPNRFEKGKINFASLIGEVTYADNVINDEETKNQKKDVEISYEVVDSGD